MNFYSWKQECTFPHAWFSQPSHQKINLLKSNILINSVCEVVLKAPLWYAVHFQNEKNLYPALSDVLSWGEALTLSCAVTPFGFSHALRFPLQCSPIVLQCKCKGHLLQTHWGASLNMGFLYGVRWYGQWIWTFDFHRCMCSSARSSYSHLQVFFHWYPP